MSKLNHIVVEELLSSESQLSICFSGLLAALPHYPALYLLQKDFQRLASPHVVPGQLPTVRQGTAAHGACLQAF